MIAAIAAAREANALAGFLGENGDMVRRDRHAETLGGLAGALGVGPGLIGGDFQFGNALPQSGIVEVGDARLDGVIEPLEP